MNNTFFKAHAVGRLGKKPEMIYTPSGTAKTTASMAVDQGYGDKKITVWLTIEVWGQSAERFSEWANKGDKIYVDGEVKIESWERDGVKHTKTILKANDWTIVERSKNGDRTGETAEVEKDIEIVV